MQHQRPARRPPLIALACTAVVLALLEVLFVTDPRLVAADRALSAAEWIAPVLAAAGAAGLGYGLLLVGQRRGSLLRALAAPTVLAGATYLLAAAVFSGLGGGEPWVGPAYVATQFGALGLYLTLAAALGAAAVHRAATRPRLRGKEHS